MIHSELWCVYSISINIQNFSWIEIQFYASTRCHCEYHIVHSGINRSTLVCHLWNTLIHCMHKLGVSKPVIIINSHEVKSWFTFANLQSVSLKMSKPETLYFLLYFVFEWPVLAYTFAHWGNIACLPVCRINTHTQTLSGSWKCYLKLWELLFTIQLMSTFVYHILFFHISLLYQSSIHPLNPLNQ